jgi:hypothetical protein
MELAWSYRRRPKGRLRNSADDYLMLLMPETAHSTVRSMVRTVGMATGITIGRRSRGNRDNTHFLEYEQSVPPPIVNWMCSAHNSTYDISRLDTICTAAVLDSATWAYTQAEGWRIWADWPFRLRYAIPTSATSG